MLLPLGSVVQLKDGEQKLMIICRLPLFNQGGRIGYFDYSACLYPLGQSSQNMFFFNAEDIDQVFFTGYKDEYEMEYQKAVDEIIGTIDYPRLQLSLVEDPVS